jgi:hypothetical protein
MCGVESEKLKSLSDGRLAYLLENVHSMDQVKPHMSKVFPAAQRV